MKNILLILIMALVFTSCSCKTKPGKATNATQDTAAVISSAENTDTDTLRQEMERKLALASFAGPQKLFKLIHFSGSEGYDSLLLFVPAGSLAKSTSRFEIRSPQGELLYSNSFNTGHFTWGMFEPELIAENENYETVKLRHTRSLTKQMIEAFAMKRINSFLDESVADKKKDLENIDATGEGFNDKETFYEIVADPLRELIITADFGSDEGVLYIGYSRKQKKGIVLAGFD